MLHFMANTLSIITECIISSEYNKIEPIEINCHRNISCDEDDRTFSDIFG